MVKHILTSVSCVQNHCLAWVLTTENCCGVSEAWLIHWVWLRSGPRRCVVETQIPLCCLFWKFGFLALGEDQCPEELLKWEDCSGGTVFIWTYFGLVFCRKSGGESAVSHFGLCLTNCDGFNLFLCDTDLHVDLSALDSMQWQKGLLWGFWDILMGSWWKWKMTLPSSPLLPVAHSFSLPFLFFPFLTLSRSFCLSLSHTPSRKNPIIEISGPCWKRDSLWNVFGVTQRQCLSCPSANRMLCAGERHEIRTERETLRKKRKEKKRQPKKAEDRICSKEKNSYETGDLEMDHLSQKKKAAVQLQYQRNRANLVQEVEVYSPPPEGNTICTIDIVFSLSSSTYS